MIRPNRKLHDILSHSLDPETVARTMQPLHTNDQRQIVEALEHIACVAKLTQYAVAKEPTNLAVLAGQAAYRGIAAYHISPIVDQGHMSRAVSMGVEKALQSLEIVKIPGERWFPISTINF